MLELQIFVVGFVASSLAGVFAWITVREMRRAGQRADDGRVQDIEWKPRAVRRGS
jgi:hypothetical protein